ncbi:MAG: HAMP domain-containing histidine kinase [Lachnospiraceae bacterium]|nr:HAMP domain-containing histidine kinase [Lachnospiraceae bacterium]
MDTSSKNKNRIGTVVFCAVIMILLAAAASMAAWKIWEKTGREETHESVRYESIVQTDVIERLYHDFYVLYAECMRQEEPMLETVGGIFIEPEESEEAQLARQYVRERIQEWKDEFSVCDFYYTDGTIEKQEAPVNLKILLDWSEEQLPNSLYQEYKYCFVLSFDENGFFSVKVHSPSNYNYYKGAEITRAFYDEHRQSSLEVQFLSDMGEETGVRFRKMQPFKAVLAIPRDGNIDLVMDVGYYIDYGMERSGVEQGTLLYCSLIIAMLLLVFVVRSRKLSGDVTSARFARKGRRYFAELAVAGLAYLGEFYTVFLHCIPTFRYFSGFSGSDWRRDVSVLVNFFIVAFSLELLCFACFWYLRPLLGLGIKEYLRQYSLIWAFCRWCKKKWEQFVEAIDKMDFGKKSSKVLLQIVLVNFLILCICVFIWVFGIIALIIYSIVLFCFLKQRYDKAAAGYGEVLRETSRIAAGELSGPVDGDFGMFTALGEELGKIKEGFRKAVEKEVKSERMKTELITNVSHDLKTPLTAIMTYVELLKREDITQEERKSYIETLESKSQRLKVLIEDLFEVSRASSNNLTLNIMDVDLVQLVKQVAVEYEDKFSEAKLGLRQIMTPERCVVQVDGQKTFRILENLFSNIYKYAMPDSRVYAEVTVKDKTVKVSLKNISANELTVNADELVERFVRGDASRNTEGSGLGLAIAKTLTEAQGGVFTVDIDGDLFKAEVSFPLKVSEDETEKEGE